MSKLILKFVYYLYFLSVINADLLKNYESVCAAQQTCSQCLQTPYCVWCSELRFSQNNGSLIRCVTREKFENEKDYWCSSKHVIANKSSVVILENKSFSRDKIDPVQVRPQKMHLTLRIGEEQKITLKYSKAEDYPVDLYYLMDLSFSMLPYRNQLSMLGDKLAEVMNRLTSNFRLGFGSFIDKVELPMTNTYPTMLKSPCELPSGEPCASPYGFKNQMRLTDNLALFKSQVKAAPVSGNIDIPEGGFDAIMQATVCTEKIGWREKARHLLVYSSDASFHIAGDGRLAGIIEPNDELCHLDENGFYSHSLLQDYPSIAQINKKVKEHNINIIFAVPKIVNFTYQTLTRSISGSSIGLLENNAKNVVFLISKEYEKLVDSVVITDDAPENIDIRYFSKCLNASSNLKERQGCDGIRVGNIIEFEIVLKALACPKNKKERRQIIKIGPRDLFESLELEVEIICDCPCEIPNNEGNVNNSPDCKNNGNLVCGVCLCNEGFYGKQCECKGTELETNSFDDCRANNQSDICSGRGTCKCGICDCNKRLNPQEEFYGTYCECDNFSCKRSGGLVCGGRGKCECGSCNCFPGWIGETCDCKESNRTCMPSPDAGVVCSGRGDCICGSCHCHETDSVRYSGQFCEKCSTCPGEQCEELKDCVECLAFQSGRLWQNNQCSCPHKLNISKVDRIDELESDKITGAKICRSPADNGCTLVFKYELIKGLLQDKERQFQIIVKKEKDCPTPLNVMGVALGVIVSTVILGLLMLLIWKILTTIHDRREYAKFEKEKCLVKWERNENPFYKKATTTFNNPMFRENTKSQNAPMAK